MARTGRPGTYYTGNDKKGADTTAVIHSESGKFKITSSRRYAIRGVILMILRSVLA